MVWNKALIVKELKKLHLEKKDLSYSALARTRQSLISAAAYHFGSYKESVHAAGLKYVDIIRRPRWTRAGIIALIKKARRKNHDLHWAAVTCRRDELGKAAFAALQTRLFGTWQRALHAAGLDGDEVARYRRWDKNSIGFELKSRAREDQPLSSGALQTEDPGLHAAAVRHFGSYDAALRYSGLEPLRYRRRRSWTKAEILKCIREASRNGHSLSDSAVRHHNPALYGAAIREFGAFTAARRAAGVRFPKKKKPRSRV
jgi:hypothetical protein